MRTIRKYFGVVAAVGLLLGVSCERSEFPDPTLPTQVVPPTAVHISKSSELTSDDAVKVAEIFRAANAPTRAAQRVRNVVTVPDAEGRPAIYAVNLEDGYLLVSATKRYYPILAQVDHGTFTLDGERFGLHVVLQEMVETIEAVRADSTLVPQSRLAWFPYEEHSIFRPQIATTRSDMDDLVACQDRWYTKWADEGCNCYPLFRKPEGLPEAVYQRFCEIADGDDAWAGTPFNCMETAVITERRVPSAVQYGPYTESRWHQHEPYNSSVPDKKNLGCVTVGVGQLMRYFRSPSTFDWNSMPYTTSSSTLSSFLARLRTELGVDDDGNTSLSSAQRVLASYGYNCSAKAHSENETQSSLDSRKPVLTSGYDQNGKGHAWIIDGYKKERSYTEYRLFVLDGAAYPDFDYFEVDSHSLNDFASVGYYSVNFGWKDPKDGWYIVGNEAFGYSTKRYDIIIK